MPSIHDCVHFDNPYEATYIRPHNWAIFQPSVTQATSTSEQLHRYSIDLDVEFLNSTVQLRHIDHELNFSLNLHVNKFT